MKILDIEKYYSYNRNNGNTDIHLLCCIRQKNHMKKTLIIIGLSLLSLMSVSQENYNVFGGKMVTKIKFGTDGWRAIMCEDFIFANVSI